MFGTSYNKNSHVGKVKLKYFSSLNSTCNRAEIFWFVFCVCYIYASGFYYVVCIISYQRNVNVINCYNMSVLLIGNKIKVLRQLFLCTFSYLQEEVGLKSMCNIRMANQSCMKRPIWHLKSWKIREVRHFQQTKQRYTFLLEFLSPKSVLRVF